MVWKQTIWVWMGVSALLTTVLPAFGEELKVIPSIAVREDYNDNIFFDADASMEDFTTTILAGLKVTDRTEVLDSEMTALVSPFFYHDNDDLDDIDQDYRGRLGYRFTPQFEMNADAGFKVDNRPDREIYETGQLFDTNRRFRYTGGVGMGYALSEIHRLSASYAYEQDDWRSDDNSDNLNYRGHLVSAGTSYDIGRWLSASALFANLGYGFYDYYDNNADIQNVYGTVGIQRMLNEILRFQASLGLRYTETNFETTSLALFPSGDLAVVVQETREEGWGGIGSVGLDFLGERTRCGLSLSHDFRPAIGTRGPTNLTRAVFDISHRLREKLTLGLSTSYFMNQADAGEFYLNEIDENTFHVRPRIQWQFMRHFSLEGAYAYSSVDDRVADTQKDRHLVYLQMEFEYPVME